METTLKKKKKNHTSINSLPIGKHEVLEKKISAFCPSNLFKEKFSLLNK